MRRLCGYTIPVVIIIILMSIVFYTSSEIDKMNAYNTSLEVDIKALQFDIQMKDKAIEEYKMMLVNKDNQITKLQQELVDIRSKIDSQLLDHVSRGGMISRRQMRITAYDLSVESCGKRPGDYGYGITSSGRPVQEWHTVAMGPNIPFGTKIYIPYFKDKPNHGIFIKEDTGNPEVVHDGVVDIFMSSSSMMDKFGVKYLDVYILKEPKPKEVDIMDGD